MKISEDYTFQHSKERPETANKSVEEKTVEFFKWKSDKVYSIEEARQINERVVVVFTLLAKWDRELRLSERAKQISLIKAKFNRILDSRPYFQFSA